MKRIVLTKARDSKERVLITSNKNRFGDKLMGEGAWRQFKEENPDAYCIAMQYFPPSRIAGMPIEARLVGLDEIWEFDGKEDIIQLLIDEKIDIVFNIFKSVIKGKPNRDAWKGQEIFALNKYRNFKSRLVVPEEMIKWAENKLERVIPRAVQEQKKLIIGMHARHVQRKVYLNMSLSWFRQLTERLQDEYDPFIIMFGAGDNRPLYEGVQVFDTLPLNTSLMETAGLLSQCDFYIGGDTGATCIAAATDTPLVGVNWCETPLNWPGRMYAVTPNRYMCLPPGEPFKPRDQDFIDLGVELPLLSAEKRNIRRHRVVFRRPTPLNDVFRAIKQVLEHKDGEVDLHHSSKIATVPVPQNDVGAHKKRGIAHYKARAYELALEEFEIATRLDPKYAEGFYLQGVVYYQLRQYDKARDTWQLTLQLNPSHKYAAEWLGNVDHILAEMTDG